MKKKAIAILSSGLDSAVNLAWAVGGPYHVVKAVTFDYGQRARERETKQAKNLAEHYRVPHEIIVLPFLASWTRTALVNQAKKLPKLKTLQLDDQKTTSRSANAVWVPNRNGVFINVAAAMAESLQVKLLLLGFNKEEGATFPDNSTPFVKAVNKSLRYSTQTGVEVYSHTLQMTKSQIVKLGIKLGLPFQWIWSCYEGQEKMCGICESCLRLKRAVSASAPYLAKVLSFAH